MCKSCESQLKTAVDLKEKLSKLHESSNEAYQSYFF